MGIGRSKPAFQNDSSQDVNVQAAKRRNNALRIEHQQWKKTVAGTAHEKRKMKHREHH